MARRSRNRIYVSLEEFRYIFNFIRYLNCIQLRNLKAVANSWPAQVLVVLNHRGYYSLGGVSQFITIQDWCGGTLIRFQKII